MKFQLPFPPTAEYAAQHAQAAVDLVQEVMKIRLDYSPASLEQVDRLIEHNRKLQVSIADAGGITFGFGCYLGEIFVRLHGATWKDTADTPLKGITEWPMVIAMPNGEFGNPIGKAFKRLENGDVDSLAYFYSTFKPATSSSPLSKLPGWLKPKK